MSKKSKKVKGTKDEREWRYIEGNPHGSGRIGWFRGRTNKDKDGYVQVFQESHPFNPRGSKKRIELTVKVKKGWPKVKTIDYPTEEEATKKFDYLTNSQARKIVED